MLVRPVTNSLIVGDADDSTIVDKTKAPISNAGIGEMNLVTRANYEFNVVVGDMPCSKAVTAPALKVASNVR